MSRLSQLLLRQGDIRAQGALAKGQHRANTIRGVGGYLPAVRRDYAAMDAAREDQYDRAQKREATAAEIKRTTTQTAGLEADQQAEQEARASAEKAKQIDAWLTSVASESDRELQTMAWVTGRQQLLSSGVIDPSDFPEQYHGPGYLRGQIARLLPVKERFAALFPEPETGVVMGPGSEMRRPSTGQRMGEPVPFKPDEPKAPEPFTLGPGQVRFGADGQRVAAGPPQREPQGAQPQQDWIVRNGQVVPIPKGSAQPGDQPYDPVSARQMNGNPDAQAEALDTAREVQRIARTLRTHEGLPGVFGVVSSRLPTFRQGTADAETLLSSLQGLLTLENMGKMKGVLSDSDMRILRQASTTLDAKMSESAARAELQRLEQVMERVVSGAGRPAGGGATGGPQVGERRLINGEMGEWDGRQWVAVD